MAVFAPLRLYTVPVISLTASGSKYETIDHFIIAVSFWLRENNITATWAGQHTQNHKFGTTYTYDISIPDEKSRVLAALKWS
jgi:hypothetical protein